MTDIVGIKFFVDSRDVKEGTKELDKFGKQGKETKKATDGLQKSFGLLKVAVAALGGAMGILSFGKTIAEFQSLERSLGVVFGSTERGIKVMEDLQKIATVTPFSINELAQSVIKLRASGIEPTNAQLKLFADVASVTTDKVGTLTAMTDLFSRSTAGGLGLEDLNRLADRGIPVFSILQEKLGLARLEVAEFGKTSEGSRKILEALTGDLQKRFGGAALDASKDLSVMWSNLGIAWGNLQKKLGESGGIGLLTGLVSGATKVIEYFTDDLGRLGVVLGSLSIVAIPAIIAGIRAIGVAVMANPIGLILTALTAVVLAAYEFRKEIGNSIVKTFEVFIPNAIDFAIIAFLGMKVGVGNLMNGMLKSINDFGNNLITGAPEWLQDFLGISGNTFKLGIDVNAAVAQIDELQLAIAERTANFKNPFVVTDADTTGGGLIDSDSLTGLQKIQEENYLIQDENERAVQAQLEKDNEWWEAQQDRDKEHDRIKLEQKQDYLERLYNMETGSMQAIADFGKAVDDRSLNGMIQHGALALSNAAKQSKTMFEMQKAYSLAKAVAALPSAVMDSFNNGGGYPWGLIPAGLMLATGLKQINDIKSATFGGGASTTSISGGSTSPSAPAGSLPPGSTAMPNGEELKAAPATREVRVTVESDGPHSDGMRKFAENLAETLKDMGSDTNMVIS